MHENSAYFVPMPFSPIHLRGMFDMMWLLIVYFFFRESRRRHSAWMEGHQAPRARQRRGGGVGYVGL